MKLLKIPFSAGGLGKSSGSEKAPDEILKELKTIILNEDGKEPDFTVVDVDTESSNIELSHDNVRKAVLALEGPALLIGGDHSITYPAFKAFASKHPGAGLIVLDAHPDTQSDFSPPTHEDYLRMLIDDGALKPENIFIIGLRAWSKEEKAYMEAKRIKALSMKRICLEGLMEPLDALMEQARGWPAVYLSIDIDVVDPSMAPGTGYREPGGLSSREALALIRRLKNLPNLKMVDIVEVNPSKDRDGLTVRLAAKMAAELL